MFCSLTFLLTSRLKSLVAEIKVFLHVFDVLHSLVHQLDTDMFREVLLSSRNGFTHLMCVSGTCTLPLMIPTLLSRFFCLSKATEFCKDFSSGPCRKNQRYEMKKVSFPPEGTASLDLHPKYPIRDI